MKSEFKTSLKKISGEKTPSTMITIREGATASQWKTYAQEIRKIIGGTDQDWKLHKDLILEIFIIPALPQSHQEALKRKLPRKGTKEARLYGEKLQHFQEDKIRARAYAHAQFKSVLNYAFETKPSKKAKDDSDHIWCPNCNALTKCREYPYSKLAIGLNDYQHRCEPDGVENLHIIDRGRLCLECRLPFHTVEVDQSFIIELVKLRQKIAAIIEATNS